VGPGEVDILSSVNDGQALQVSRQIVQGVNTPPMAKATNDGQRRP